MLAKIRKVNMRTLGYVLIGLVIIAAIYGLIDLGPKNGWFLIPLLIIGVVAIPFYILESRRRK